MAVNAIVAGLGALSGLFGKKTTQQQQQTSNSASQTQNTNTNIANNASTSQTNQITGNTNTPNIDPTTQALLEQIKSGYASQLGTDTDLSGYAANQTEGINNQSQLQQKALSESLAARGITGPAAATAIANADAQRFSGITTLKNSIPLMAQQLQQQKLQAAGGFANSTLQGSTQSGFNNTGNNTSSQQINQNFGTTDTQSNESGTGSSSGNSGGGIGGLAGGLGPILAYLYGQKNNNPQQPLNN